MPAVTVVTAVRNGARYLPETLESIRAQSLPDWEYLVVDDASEDDSAGIVLEAAARDSRIRLLRRRVRGGPFVAANEAIRQARGRWVARCDADDVSLPERFETQIAFLRANPSLRACASLAQVLGEPGPPRDLPRTPGRLRWALCLGCVLHHSTAFVEREVFQVLGGYREAPVAQDYRFWCDVARRGWVGVVPRLLVRFRRHPGSISATRRAEQHAASLETLGDHLRALTGESWSDRELEALYAVGRELRHPCGEGLRVLARLESALRADPTVSGDDRAAVAAIFARRRLAFLARNLRRQPLALVHWLRAWMAGA